ncbi:thioredoxin family protein [Stieleria marina]|uniref:thioredoxin family protein n=1 Tax=Stieleria marina TaxID=1930275 RepID=UPI003AF39BB2
MLDADPPEQVSEPPLATSPVEAAHADFYTVSTYDESFDPTDDLAKTLVRAANENKRVILQIGGDWCGWCARITDYMSTNETIRSHIDNNFVVMKVTFPGEHAKDFLSAYPKCNAYPHFFVLDENGDFLHSQGTGELEKGKGYDQDVFMAFLTKWTP